MDDNRRTERFRWHWVVGSALSGTTLLVTAYIGALRWEWSNIATSIMVGLGAPLVLAFILFLFERRFTQNVAEQVRGATERIVAERTSELGSRIDDLESRLSARKAAIEAVQDDYLKEIDRNLSFESIHDAIDEAQRVGAISKSGLVVPGSTEEPRMLVGFSLCTHPDVFRVTRDLGGRDKVVLVEVYLPGSDGGACQASTLWEPGMSSEDVYENLRIEMQSSDCLDGSKTLNLPHAIHELVRGIELAWDNQRVPLGEETFRGILHDIIDEEWVITSKGVWNTESGFSVVPTKTSPSPTMRALGALPGRGLPADAPDSIDQELWELLRYRVARSSI